MALLVPSSLGEHHQVLAQGKTKYSCGELITTKDAAQLFSIISREINIPVTQWRGILIRSGISIPPNFHHTADIYRGVITLCQSGHLQLVKIPRLEQLPSIATSDGWGYCFIRGPEPHPSLSYSPILIASLQDAQHFLDSINAGEKVRSLFFQCNPFLIKGFEGGTNPYKDLAELLANKNILVYKIPVATATPAVNAMELLPATAIDREIPSVPENRLAPGKPHVASNKKSEPKSLDDCVQGLIDARKKLDTEGYKAKYTDAQQLQKVNEGSVRQERFLVSFQTKNTNPDAKLAFQRDSGLAPVWATSFDQLENADTDPQLIADVLGTPYDTSREYVLHIVDRGESFNQFGQNTLIPTWDNMQEPVQKYLGGKHDSHVLTEVMTPEYQKQYAKDIEAYCELGLGEFNDRDQATFSKKLSESDKPKFGARHNVRTELGANSEFTGNGLTQSREGSTRYGVVETLTLENNSLPISRMRNVKTVTLMSRGLV